MTHIPPCTHRPPCPGCPRYGEGGVAPATAVRLEDLAAVHGARLDPVVEGEGTGFRVRARLAVRGRASSPKLGLFQEGTHSIADIPSCPIHHPRINAVARALREAMRRSSTPPYADRPHAGLLRYVQLVLERTSGRVQVVLVANSESADAVAPLAAALEEAAGQMLQGVWWNGNTARTNAIFGPHWARLRGREAVEETIGGVRVYFPPGAFGQNNLGLADRLVSDVHARIADGLVVAEWYAGVGAIGLGLVPRSREVRFNEVNPHGLAGLARGLDALGVEALGVEGADAQGAGAEGRGVGELGLEALAVEGAGVEGPRRAPGRARVTVMPGEAGAAAGMLAGADVAIVDPPRKGLDAPLLEALAASPPPRLLYVSCDVDSLARDAARLAAAGLRPTRLTPYALFPYTAHVETLAEFVG